VHLSIQKLAADIVQKFGTPDQSALLVPSSRVADICARFILNHPQSKLHDNQMCILELVSQDWPNESSTQTELVSPTIYACLFPQDHYPIAKQFWQHTGCGVSSRRAEYCKTLFDAGHLAPRKEFSIPDELCKGPKRYRRRPSTSDSKSNGTKTFNNTDFENKFVEERFGRNLDISLSRNAKLAIRRRIAGRLLLNVGLSHALNSRAEDNTTRTGRTISEDDVYLYPTGMNAIFNSHHSLINKMGSLKSVCYG